MRILIIILFAFVCMSVPISVLALVTCHDRIGGCTFEEAIQMSKEASDMTRPIEERIRALQDAVLALTSILAQRQTDTLVQEGVCLSLQYDLYIGKTDATTDGEVTELQHFLIKAGVYPEAQVTGYYGPLTAQAVVRWQKAHGMDFVTNASGVGDMTRSKMRESCVTTEKLIVTGTYSFSDMTAFGRFIVPAGPFRRSATIVFNSDHVVSVPQGTMHASGPFYDDVTDGMSPFSDSCNLSFENVKVEIRNFRLVGKATNGDDLIEADFVKVVDRGVAYDVCTDLSSGTQTRVRR